MHRGWQENPIFEGQQFSERDAWCYLIENASYLPSKMRHKTIMISLGRGDVPTSYRKLSTYWRWSVNRVTRFLKLLQCERMISLKTDTGFLVVSICNYEQYQTSLINTDTVTDTVANTHTDTVTDTNIKKGNKRKRKEKKESLSKFDIFFEKFPRQRRGSKHKTLPAWNNALIRTTEKEILDGLEAYLNSASVRDGFAKGAAAWLRDDGWDYRDTDPGKAKKPAPSQAISNYKVL